jgi:hypothetical protein
MSLTCLLVWVLVLITLPLLLLWNLTESKGTKIRRARANGQTWKVIAKRWGVSPTTCRRWATL